MEDRTATKEDLTSTKEDITAPKEDLTANIELLADIKVVQYLTHSILLSYTWSITNMLRKKASKLT